MAPLERKEKKPVEPNSSAHKYEIWRFFFCYYTLGRVNFHDLSAKNPEWFFFLRDGCQDEILIFFLDNRNEGWSFWKMLKIT